MPISLCEMPRTNERIRSQELSIEETKPENGPTKLPPFSDRILVKK